MTTKPSPRPRARSAGSGTIWEKILKDGSKVYVAQIRTTTSRPSKTFTSNRKAVSWLAQMRRELDTGEYIEPSEMPLGKWWDKWVDVYKSQTVSKASLITYKQSRARLKKHSRLLDVPLAKIQPADIQQAINQLAHLSVRTRSLTLTHLRDCLKRAQMDGLTRSNAAATVKPPRIAREAPARAKYIDDTIYDAMLATVKQAPRTNADGTVNKTDLMTQAHLDAILFMAQTGVRRGEAIALRWDRIIGQTATIDRSMDDDNEDGLTKTRQARTVPLTNDILAMLERRRFSGGDLVFSTRNHKPLNPRNLLRTMQKMTGHNLHDLRHTYITRAARKGVNPKVLQTITGHRSLAVVLDVYTHVTDDDRQEANAKINAIGK